MRSANQKHPILLSIVMVVDGWAEQAPAIVRSVALYVNNLVSDYEIILVDISENLNSKSIYKRVTALDGEPNVQVFCLLNRVHYETAAWAGVENSLGDFILVVEPFSESLEPLDSAIEEATKNAVDLVLLANEAPRLQSRTSSVLRIMYSRLFRLLGGVNLQLDAAQYRLMSKRVVSYLLQQPNAADLYRTLPITAGFSKRVIRYSTPRRP